MLRSSCDLEYASLVWYGRLLTRATSDRGEVDLYTDRIAGFAESKFSSEGSKRVFALKLEELPRDPRALPNWDRGHHLYKFVALFVSFNHME